MHADKQTLKPQADEDIEKAKWLTVSEFFKKKRPVFRSILDVIDMANKPSTKEVE